MKPLTKNLVLRKSRGLTSLQKLMVWTILSHCDHRNQTWASIGLLAEECEMSRRTARRHLAGLEAAGVISRAWADKRTQTITVYMARLRQKTSAVSS